MPFYKVLIHQEREWGGTIEADCADDAAAIAHLEATFDFIVDEETTVESLKEGEDDNEDTQPAERDYIYYT